MVKCLTLLLKYIYSYLNLYNIPRILSIDYQFPSFTDAYAVAIAISLDPGNAAIIQCSITSINAADSRHLPLSIPLDGPSAVEHILQATLKSLAEAITPRPLISSLLIPEKLLHGACCLLSCNSVPLQAAALQLITSIVRAQPQLPLPLLRVSERLKSMVHSMNAQVAGSEESRTREEWNWRFTALLQALLEQAAVDTAAQEATRHTIIQIAVSAADFLPEQACGRLCELVAELVMQDPFLLESATGVLRMLPKCPSPARLALLHALRLYFETFPVQQALKAAIEASEHISDDSSHIALKQRRGGLIEEEVGRMNTGKRQRMSRSLPESEEQDGLGPMHVDEPLPAGLASVACALHAVAHDLQNRIRHSATLALTPEDITKALIILSDIVNALAPVLPTIQVQWAVESVKNWTGWGALQFGGRGLPENQLQAGLNLLSSGLQAVLRCSLQERGSIIGLDVVTAGLHQSLLACARGEGPAVGGALAISLLT